MFDDRFQAEDGTQLVLGSCKAVNFVHHFSVSFEKIWYRRLSFGRRHKVTAACGSVGIVTRLRAETPAIPGKGSRFFYEYSPK